VKPSTAFYPKQHMFVKRKRKKKPEVEGAPAPEKSSLSHFHYGNITELGAADQFVTSLDSVSRTAKLFFLAATRSIVTGLVDLLVK